MQRRRRSDGHRVSFRDSNNIDPSFRQRTEGSALVKMFRRRLWRGWLKPENRCLVPFNAFNSFAEYAPEPNPETKKKDVV